MRSALLLGDIGVSANGTDVSFREVAETLAPAVEDLVVACSDDRRETVVAALEGVDYRLAVDPIADEGPVAAIRTGVRVATGASVAVVAGDVPSVDVSLLADLADACEDAAVPETDGRLHPLHAVYDAAAVRAACDHTLASGSGRLYDVLSRLDPVVVAADAPDVDAHPLATGARAHRTPATDRLGT